MGVKVLGAEGVLAVEYVVAVSYILVLCVDGGNAEIADARCVLHLFRAKLWVRNSAWYVVVVRNTPGSRVFWSTCSQLEHSKPNDVGVVDAHSGRKRSACALQFSLILLIGSVRSNSQARAEGWTTAASMRSLRVANVEVVVKAVAYIRRRSRRLEAPRAFFERVPR